MSLPPWSHILPLFFCLYEFYLLSQSTHTKHHVYILPLLYLHPDFILLLHLPFEGTNLPHLVTLRLDLARTKLKNLYFIVLMDLSYTTYSVTTFCLPYSWYDYTFCLPLNCNFVLLNYLTFNNCIFLNLLFVYLTYRMYVLLYIFLV